MCFCLSTFVDQYGEFSPPRRPRGFAHGCGPAAKLRGAAGGLVPGTRDNRDNRDTRHVVHVAARAYGACAGGREISQVVNPALSASVFRGNPRREIINKERDDGAQRGWPAATKSAPRDYNKERDDGAARMACCHSCRSLGLQSPMILSTFAMCALVQIIYEWDHERSCIQCDAVSAFKATVTSVGTLFFVHALVQVAVQPFWGYASDFLPQLAALRRVCLIWGSVTTVMAFVSAWPAILVLRGCAGVGLAAILPVIHHLVGDAFVPNMRGRVFGALGAFQMLGGILSIEFATNLSVQEKIAGMAGWRFTFLCTGVLGLVVGIAVFFCLKVRNSPRPRRSGKKSKAHCAVAGQK